MSNFKAIMIQKLYWCRVIATDLDGTLLEQDHKLGQDAYDVIQEAKAAGIRVIIATGRDYLRMQEAFGKYKLDCECIVASGAELRDEQGNILKSIPMNKKDIPTIMSCLQDKNVFVRFCTTEFDYFIGTEEEYKHQVIMEANLFFGKEAIKNEDPVAKEWMNAIDRKMRCVDSLEILMEMDAPIFKVFMAAEQQDVIDELNASFVEIEGIAAAASFPKNLELTHVKAQKGVVLADYIQEVGYTMDEVMVLGDGLNDYSMLSMDFGATVAMGDGMDEVKKVAKYITRSNPEHGAEYAIRAAILNRGGMLEHLGDILERVEEK